MKPFKANKDKPTVNISEVKIGDCFTSNKTPYMKIYPVPSFFNSHMVSDIANRGDSFAVNLNTGVFTCFPAVKNIIPINLEYVEN